MPQSDSYIWDAQSQKWVRQLGGEGGIVIACRCANTITDKRMTSVGLVVGSEAYLYWVTFNPTGGLASIGLADAVVSGGTIKWDMLGAWNEGKHVNIDPPLHFSTGIYLEEVNYLYSAIFGYDLA